jgi:hypothetical protein
MADCNIPLEQFAPPNESIEAQQKHHFELCCDYADLDTFRKAITESSFVSIIDELRMCPPTLSGTQRCDVYIQISAPLSVMVSYQLYPKDLATRECQEKDTSAHYYLYGKYEAIPLGIIQVN